MKNRKLEIILAAVIALLIGGATGVDYNPVSLEQQQAAIETIQEGVYWTRFGKVYHTHDDCQALNRTEELKYGYVEEALEAGKTRLCSFCAKRDAITGVATDNVDVSDYVPEESTAAADSAA